MRRSDRAPRAPRARRVAAATALVVALAAAAACTADDGPATAPSSPGSPTATTSPTGTARPTDPTSTGEPPSSSPAPPRPPRVSPGDARVRTAVEAVTTLAGRIGPRHGTSRAYLRAAAWVEARLREHGWQVARQRFPVPGGVSWGVPVDAGRSVNLVATRGTARPGRPWLAVGAHLDTVPQAPGAEDNASGIGVLLAVAEALAERRTRLPVVLVAFGAEEPRGPGDDDHHYGSRAYVDALSPAQRRSLRGMVSLDRVGVGPAVVIGSPDDGDPLRAELVRAAERAGAPYVVEGGQRSSDHWSFVRAGLPGVRLGSTPYAGYHSAGDVPSVVSRAQLERTARVVLAWLR
ncbi:M28 family metallopeptidase [Nocardioides sp. TF02-7]|uniref:M28 family metallopeptidase n=1 Tax=Nocardioides sp. TF02-7 TaxID=2917724 RepID=UPI001F05C08C|nr:M28 family metallopeptidase [Nocardioides sp. TF02-7]UMG94591.1 M28 family metallopeptidase [Nocardioides sp. TF02-7]